MREIPESVRAAVEGMDAEICKAVDSVPEPVEAGESSEKSKTIRFGRVFGGVVRPSTNIDVDFKDYWYARVDSNHRPFAPEANALSN